MCPPVFSQIIKHSPGQNFILCGRQAHLAPVSKRLLCTYFSPLGLAFHDSMLLQLVKKRLIVDVQL